MSRLPSLCLLVLACVLPCAAPAAAEDPERAALIAADDARLAAFLKGDAAALEPLLEPGLSYVHATGAVQTRAELLATVGSRGLIYKAIELGARSARGYGEAGVVLGTGEFTFETRGQTLKLALRYTATYVRRDGHWLLAAYQSTVVPPAAEAVTR